MKNTLAKRFRDEALTFKTIEEFERLREREKRNQGFGHKFWGMLHFDDESMVEYHVYDDDTERGVKIWVYNEPRRMGTSPAKYLRFEKPFSPEFLTPAT